MAALELCLPPEDLPRLLRSKVFGRRSGRAVETELVWHDTAGSALAADHLSLCQTGTSWRLEQASPPPGTPWAPGMPTRLVAEADEPESLGPWPGPLMPFAGFRGQTRTIRLAAEGAATLSVLTGTLRGVTQERPVCRLVLDGPVASVVALSTEWASSLPVGVPPWSLAAEALALARGRAPPPFDGAPKVPEGMTLADATVLVVGHMAAVILAAAAAASSELTADAVHAMRVATRRLRSALSVFGRAAPGAALDDVKSRVAALATVLGGARDWDVFLAGTGAEITAAFPEDARIQTLLAAAERRRDAAYAVLRREFASVSFRQFSMALAQFAICRPWEADADEALRAEGRSDAAAFARHALSRQHRHLLADVSDIAALPLPDLHALRKRGKRLRYTAEFFAPLYPEAPTRRFLRRLSRLQEVLGHLNDGAAAADLMQTLRSGTDGQFAIGVVQGFTAARSTDGRAAIVKSWRKLRRAKPFWLRN